MLPAVMLSPGMTGGSVGKDAVVILGEQAAALFELGAQGAH